MIGALFGQSWTVAAAAPFLGAALALLIPQARLAWVLGVAGLAIATMFAIDAGLGGVLPQAANGASLFSVPLVAGSAALCLLAGGGALRQFQASTASFVVSLTLCCAGGWMFALLANDWVGFAIGAEAAWLAGAGVVALGDAKRGALSGALRMLTSGGVSAALMLLGVAFVGRATYSMDIAALANASNADLCIVGVVLVLVSLGVKAGLAPLHPWAGAVFGRAGAFSSLLIGAVSTVGALAAIVRIGAAAATAPQQAAAVEATIAAMGAASIVIGSIQAMAAANLRRLAAYAFASQAGCVLLSVSLGSPAGVAAALVQMFALAAAMLVLLGATASTSNVSFDALDGLARRDPIAGVAVTVGALSLMGAPLTIGFLGRWRLIEAAVGAGWWWVAGIALLSSLAAVFYGGRLIERVYFRRVATVTEPSRDMWRVVIAPVLAAAIFAIGVGVEPSFILQTSSRAAAHIFGTAP